jgi:hypothetical protein
VYQWTPFLFSVSNSKEPDQWVLCAGVPTQTLFELYSSSRRTLVWWSGQVCLFNGCASLGRVMLPPFLKEPWRDSAVVRFVLCGGQVGTRQ